MKNLYLSFLMMCFFGPFLFGQKQWINYTNNYSVSDVIEVDNGTWISSTGGLCFVESATQAETYYNRGNSNIPSNTIYDMLLHPSGDLWITTSLGLCKLSDGEIIRGPKNLWGIMHLTPDDKVVVANFDSLFIQDVSMKFNGIPYPDIVAGVENLEIASDGAIYVNIINFFGESYIAVYKDGKWSKIFSEFVYHTSMVLDSKDKLWFFSQNELLSYEGGVWKKEISIDNVQGLTFKKLYLDHHDNILLEVNAICASLYVYSGFDLKELEYVQGDCVNCKFVGPSKRKEGVYFASNTNQGFYSFTRSEKGPFKAYSQSPLKSNTVLTTLHPEDGSHYVVSSRHIQQIKNGLWSDVPLPMTLSSTIQYAHLWKESLLISSGNNIWVSKNGKWTDFVLPIGFTGKIKNLVVGPDVIWFQSGTYLHRFKDNQWESFGTADHKVTNSLFREMAIDTTTGELWAATFKEVLHYNGTVWTLYEFELDFIYRVAIGKEGVYACGNQLYHIQNGIVDSIEMPSKDKYGTFFSKMKYDKTNDVLYLSGYDHLATYENGVWENIYSTQNSALYNGATNELTIDKQGNLWLSGSAGGLEVFNPEGIILSVNQAEQAEKDLFIEVYPTVLHGENLFVKALKGGLYNVQFHDMNGKLLKNDSISLLEKSVTAYQLPSISKGIYIITFFYNGRCISKKLVKQH